MFIETFSIAFFSILILEMGDKTQLIVLSITTKYKDQKLAILSGFFFAILFVSFAAVILGTIIKEIIPNEFIRFIGASLFLFVGIYAMIDWYNDKKHENENDELNRSRFTFSSTFRSVLVQTFLLIFMMELGDKSQIFIITLATQVTDLIAVVLGATLGMTMLALVAIITGDIILKIIPESFIKLVSGVLFIVIGIIMFF
ncbi:MAG: hypothetical protein HeimC3_15350 [Candidatus Heimdallarchaeota archaeon LC_3]|nr:MAG: hypothetical protein HeimC3_15350 [Candidatus Heimdallarchaeota archaeon LC_3]